jgi:hypothetical protein
MLVWRARIDHQIVDVMWQKKVAAQNTGELASAPVDLGIGINATETTSGSLRESVRRFMHCEHPQDFQKLLLSNLYKLSLLPLFIKITYSSADG